MVMPITPVITSVLDTDLYKITMHAAVHRHFADAPMHYKLTNRTPLMALTPAAVAWLQQQIAVLDLLQVTEEELQFLRTAVPYLPEEYLTYLATFRFNPAKEVSLSQDEDGTVHLEVAGPWAQVILYEIPLLALVLEAYFRVVDKDWTLDGQAALAASKCAQLFDAECVFSEFGTRRRRLFQTQEVVVKALAEYAAASATPQRLLGTLNVLLAKRYGLAPIGTVAHEWFMGIAALTQDYVHANTKAMDCWIDTVGEAAAGLALTDTFGTDDFLRQFTGKYAEVYRGVRQDSGSPAEYTKRVAAHYKALGVPDNTKIICYSDLLTVERCVEYRDCARANGLIPLFGIGTYFTNDFRNSSGEKLAPLNIVIKLTSAGGHPAIKISDNAGKNMGEALEVARVKQQLGYTEREWAVREDRRW